MLGHPVKVNVLRHAKKCKTCNLGYIIIAINGKTGGITPISKGTWL